MSPQWISVVGLLAVSPVPVSAHDIYSHLVHTSGRSCCDNHDCHPAHYRLRSTGVEMFIHGQWLAVPAEKIQYRVLLGDTGETYGGHWCGAYDPRLGVLFDVRCA